VRLSGFEPMEYILGQWNRSDLLIEELKRIGRRLREAGSALDPAEGAQLLRQIHRVNTTLVPLEDDLAQTLAEIQRTAQSFLIGGILIISGVLLIGGIMLSRRFLGQNEEMQRTMAESQSQLRNLVET